MTVIKDRAEEHAAECDHRVVPCRNAIWGCPVHLKRMWQCAHETGEAPRRPVGTGTAEGEDEDEEAERAEDQRE